MTGDTDQKPADAAQQDGPAGSKLGDMGKGSFEQSQREGRQDGEGKGEVEKQGEGAQPSPAP